MLNAPPPPPGVWARLRKNPVAVAALLVLAFIVLTSGLNIVGIELAARFNIVLMIVQLGIAAIFVVLCCHYAAAAAGPAREWDSARRRFPSSRHR